MTHSLQELRDSLDQHSHDLADHAAAARSAAVRRRVGVVRKRRRATAAGGLVLTLLVGAGVALGLRPAAAPVGPMALGQRAPLTMQSLDYTYRATGEVHTYTDRGTLAVEPQPEPRLVSWTTDGADAVTFRLLDGRVLRSAAAPFGDFVYLPAGQGGRLQVSAPDHRVALVDYALTGSRPAGVTQDGITFRRTVAGQDLLVGAIGDEGQGSLSTSYTAPSGPVSMSVLALGLPRGAWLHVLVNDRDRVISRGADDDFDPGASSRSTFRVGTEGMAVPVRLLVTDGVRSMTPYAGDLGGVRIGVGVYDGRPTGEIEQDGHTWVRDDATSAAHGDPLGFDFQDMDTFGHLDSPRLLSLTWESGSDLTAFRIRVDGRTVSTARFEGPGRASSGGYWVPAGTRQVRVEWARGTGHLSAVLYRADAS